MSNNRGLAEQSYGTIMQWNTKAILKSKMTCCAYIHCGEKN